MRRAIGRSANNAGIVQRACGSGAQRIAQITTHRSPDQSEPLRISRRAARLGRRRTAPATAAREEQGIA